jgi:hypothetical protein
MIKFQPSLLLVGPLAFLIYLLTLAPTLTWRNEGADSGDLAAAVATGGVPHPPGYPTYLLLGQIFKRLPFGDTAYRLNLMSAACASLAVTILALTIYQTLSSTISLSPSLARFCALSASLALAFSPTFWSQAVIAEVYALNTLFMALLFYGALQVRSTNDRTLVPALWGLWGLSLGNHLSAILFSPLLFWLKVRWNWTLAIVTAFAFCAGLSIYLIIPFRAAASPPINWGMATTWSNFLWLVSAEPYHNFPLPSPGAGYPFGLRKSCAYWLQPLWPGASLSACLASINFSKLTGN